MATGFNIGIGLHTIILIIYGKDHGSWRGGCVMDCHATAPGSIPGGYGVKTELHVLRKGQ